MHNAAADQGQCAMSAPGRFLAGRGVAFMRAALITVLRLIQRDRFGRE
jgi:hypothetical protein